MAWPKDNPHNKRQQAASRKRLKRIVHELARGRPKSEIARDFGISRKRLYDLIAIARHRGLTA